MRVLLGQLQAAAQAATRATDEVARLTERAFLAGATNRQIADATGETVDCVRVRRRRRDERSKAAA